MQFQSVLRAQLRAIEAAQLHNLYLQKRMRTLVTAATKTAKPAKTTRTLAVSLLFPDDPKAEEALENDDVKKKRARQQMVPLHHKFKRWTKAELDGLSKGAHFRHCISPNSFLQAFVSRTSKYYSTSLWLSTKARTRISKDSTRRWRFDDRFLSFC